MGKVLWLVLVHAVVLRAALDTRVKDAGYYRKVRPYQAGRPDLSGLGILRVSPPSRTSSILIEAARAATPEAR